MKRIYIVALLLALIATPAQAEERPDIFTIIVSIDGRAWEADYDRTLTPEVGWTDGDRVGYRCAYMFLQDRGHIVGRVTFLVVDGASTYAAINDKFMAEGERFYDGTVNPDPTIRQLNDCPHPEESYEPYFGPDQRPTITYERARGGVLETRDYSLTAADPGVTFQQVSSSDDRVTIVAYRNGLPGIVVYYDSMSPRVVMNSSLG